VKKYIKRMMREHQNLCKRIKKEKSILKLHIEMGCDAEMCEEDVKLLSAQVASMEAYESMLSSRLIYNGILPCLSRFNDSIEYRKI
jgi:hypothetical protein